jgi:membrane fusion protein, heavy metal efflux system
MKSIFFFLLLSSASMAIDAKREADTVILNEIQVKNLRIETTEVEEGAFDETVFALGRIEPVMANKCSVSTRVAGRISELNVSLGDAVAAGQQVAKLEARTPGDPPTIITLTAPKGGIVTQTSATLGGPLEPEAVLLEITDLTSVYAIAKVPEHLAGKLKPEMDASIAALAAGSEPMAGKFLRFGAEADRASNTLEAYFTLANPTLALRPGMRAEFSIVTNTRENVMSVPRSAIQGDAANRFLYVKDFELPNAFVKTAVELGTMTEGRAEVLSGLLPGDEVVTRGGYSLAFAGGGSVSLKEALDAAHGHEHNEDGSEMSPEQKAEAEKNHSEGGAETHEHASSAVWKVLCGVLAAIALGQAVMMRKQPIAD